MVGYFSSGRFWAGPFSWGIGILVGGLIAYAWTVFGGFPHDADRYGRVPVPGKATVELPEGKIPLDFENVMVGGGDTRSIEDQPEGLAVEVQPKNGDGELAVDDVPSWLFSSSVGDRGHEPFGRIDVPRAGSYVVRTSAAGGAPGDPAIVVGATPWTPLGSIPLGAALAFVVVFSIAALPGLIIRRVMR